MHALIDVTGPIGRVSLDLTNKQSPQLGLLQTDSPEKEISSMKRPARRRSPCCVAVCRRPFPETARLSAEFLAHSHLQEMCRWPPQSRVHKLTRISTRSPRAYSRAVHARARMPLPAGPYDVAEGCHRHFLYRNVRIILCTRFPRQKSCSSWWFQASGAPPVCKKAPARRRKRLPNGLKGLEGWTGLDHLRQ